MTRGRPQSSWAISLADVKRGLFQRDVPGVEKAGTDIISRSDPDTEDVFTVISLGDHFTDVVVESFLTQFCTLKSILILNSDPEYLKTVYTRHTGETLWPVCPGNSVLINTAKEICVLK